MKSYTIERDIQIDYVNTQNKYDRPVEVRKFVKMKNKILNMAQEQINQDYTRAISRRKFLSLHSADLSLRASLASHDGKHSKFGSSSDFVAEPAPSRTASGCNRRRRIVVSSQTDVKRELVRGVHASYHTHVYRKKINSEFDRCI